MKHAIKTNISALIILILLTALVYLSSLYNGFVWDDDFNIVKNDFIKNWHNVPFIFSRDYLTSPDNLRFLGLRFIGSGEMSYRPVATISYFIDHTLWGLNPFGYHLTNLILHIFNVLLCFAFLQRFIKDKNFSLCGALVFAFHPVQTEAVMAISFREDLLAFFFFMSALMLYFKAERQLFKLKPWLYVLSCLCYFLAVFSKEMAITLPLILFICDRFQMQNREERARNYQFLARYIGYVIVMVFFLWVYFFPMARFTGKAPITYPGGGFYTNVLTMVKVMAQYYGWILWPVDVHPTLPDPAFTVHSLFNLTFFISSVVVGASIFMILRLRKCSTLFSLSFFWFFITLLPVLNIIPIQNIIACRYLYLPMVGVALFVAVMLKQIYHGNIALLKNIRFPLVRVVFICYLMLMATMTIVRSYYWNNELVFRMDIVRHYPHHGGAHTGLAHAYRNNGLILKAIEEFKIVKQLIPGYWDSSVDLGLAYFSIGRIDEAIEELSAAVDQYPYNVNVYNTLCSLMAVNNQYEKSVACYNNLLDIHPEHIDAYGNLGLSYLHLNRPRKAKRVWKDALTLDPDNESIKMKLLSLK